MATYDLNETQFNALIGPHVTSATLTAIDNYLIGKGFFTNPDGTPDIAVQGLSGYPTLDSKANFWAEEDAPVAQDDKGTKAVMAFVEPGANFTLHGNRDMAV